MDYSFSILLIIYRSLYCSVLAILFKMSDEFYTDRQVHYLAKLTELTYAGDLANLPVGRDVAGPWFSESRSGY